MMLKPFKVDIEKALNEAKTINLSEYCDSIEYIPLETRLDFSAPHPQPCFRFYIYLQRISEKILQLCDQSR